ncbi:MAG: hypothetical protein CMK08_12415 [Ponticaulis sp.]|nr:hypothetical protein [Ponticaulis sp.]MBN04968.1 hypothetical protein [Ponticaulis sp.]
MRISINNEDLWVELDDSSTAKDFASLMPMTLTLDDYASKEKVSDLPRRLNTDGAPRGYQPSAGDITYYEPWGNLAIFYKDFGYSNGLIRLGHIAGPLTALTQTNSVRAAFSL